MRRPHAIRGELAVGHSLVWRNAKVTADLSPEAITKAVKDPNAVVWLDLASGDIAKDRQRLLRTFSLAPLTVTTMADPDERARLVVTQNYAHLIAHGLDFDTQTLEAATPKLDIVFGSNWVVTAHAEPMQWMKTLWEAARTGKSEDHIMSRGAPYLVYAILDSLVDSYFPVLDSLDDLIDDLENKAVAYAANDVQARIFSVKRSLAYMRRVISPQVEVANGLITRTAELIPRDAEPYFAEVHDHLVRAFEVLDSYRDLMSGLLDVYLTTVSNRLNVIMKQLTIIATIFMPITFITGIFGQNFGYMPQVAHDGGANFWLVLLAMAIISGAQIWYFKRRGWL